jgi:hypothetical protein
MSKYKLDSKQIALITQSLLHYGMLYECENKRFQETIRKDAQEIINFLIEQHNNQEEKNLMYYNNYVRGENKEVGLLNF